MLQFLVHVYITTESFAQSENVQNWQHMKWWDLAVYLGISNYTSWRNYLPTSQYSVVWGIFACVINCPTAEFQIYCTQESQVLPESNLTNS